MSWRIAVYPVTKKIPANTTKATELTRFRVYEGILHRVIIDIPSGWQYSAGIRIRHSNGTLLFPDIEEGTDEWITGDDSYYDLIINKPVPSGKLIIEGINNTAYDQPFTMLIVYLVRPGWRWW